MLNKKANKEFLEWAFKKRIPSGIIMRLRYTKRLFLELLDMLRGRLGGDHIQVALDETSDSSLRSLGAFTVTSMDRPLGPYLINLKEMKGGKNKDITDFFEESLKVLYPNGKAIM